MSYISGVFFLVLLATAFDTVYLVIRDVTLLAQM